MQEPKYFWDEKEWEKGDLKPLPRTFILQVKISQ